MLRRLYVDDATAMVLQGLVEFCLITIHRGWPRTVSPCLLREASHGRRRVGTKLTLRSRSFSEQFESEALKVGPLEESDAAIAREQERGTALTCSGVRVPDSQRESPGQGEQEVTIGKGTP